MACDKCDGSGTWGVLNSPNRYQCSRCYGTGGTLPGIAYAGVGSRETPLPVIREMENVAMQLALRGFALRSGEAKRPPQAKPDTDSADLAFERGCVMVRGKMAIRCATSSPAALDHAERYHPNWPACSPAARALHARNSLIMLGDWLDDPVRFVVCWTAGGAVVGGTGQALRIAAATGIPVFNLAVTPVSTLWSWLDGK